MPKIILTLVTGTATDKPVLSAAIAAARLFDAHLVALHPRLDVRLELARLAANDMGMGGGLESFATSMEDEAEKGAAAAEKHWSEACDHAGVTRADRPGTKGGQGVTSTLVVETGAAPDWLAEYGRTADLIVVGRDPDSRLDVLEAALLDTGKPVLIATERLDPCLHGVVAIAWKNTAEAAGAVSAAMPFIAKALRVVILSIEEDPDVTDASVERLAKNLRWHNPNVEIRRQAPGGADPIDALLEAADKAGADLVVMGGYGHTRIREAVFGGFTRAVLQGAALPVLMAH